MFSLLVFPGGGKVTYDSNIGDGEGKQCNKVTYEQQVSEAQLEVMTQFKQYLY